MNRLVRFAILAAFLVSATAFQQALNQKEQDVTQEQIDKAIDHGVKFLLDQYKDGIPNSQELELVVYTLLHGDVDPGKHKILDDALGTMMTKSLDRTYNVGLTALAFHTLLSKIITGKVTWQNKKNASDAEKNRLLKAGVSKIQKRIADAGQWLVDSQLNNGQWTYTGQKVHEPKKDAIDTGTGSGKDEGYTHMTLWENAARASQTLYKLIPKSGKVKKRTELGKQGLGSQRGDNSNTQYGILGLVAAQLSGSQVPMETWDLSMKWFEGVQGVDGGFHYSAGNSYGSMSTAGALALAATYRFIGKDPKGEQKFKNAIEWLGKNFTVSDNPGVKSFHYYYLYGLERVGAFWGEPKMGGHDWYKEGAGYLVKSQGVNGSWTGKDHESAAIATCFAVLFLKRASSDIMTGGGIDAK